MLPREYRLTRKKDFEILFKEGRFVAGKYTTLKVWKIDVKKYEKRGYSVDDLKIGFVVGVKVSKKAVERNRAKRQMREVVRLLLKEGKITTGYMIAFVAKGPVLGASFDEIQKDEVSLLSQARVLKK